MSVDLSKNYSSHGQRLRLLEPLHIKNIQRRDKSLNVSNKLPTESQMHGNLSALNLNSTSVKVELLQNPEFGLRNFARLCDRNLIGMSRYHEQQRFGKRNFRNTRLAPLKHSKIDQLQAHLMRISQQKFSQTNEPILTEEEPKDENQDLRKQVKQIINTREASGNMIFFFKSFIISEHQDISKKPDVKSKKSTLILTFQEMQYILSLPSLEEMLHFLQENLEVFGHTKIKLKSHRIKEINLNPNNNVELPKRLFIENKNGSGYFQVEFPRIELYKPDYAFTQKMTLNTRAIFELLRLNFENKDIYLSQFDQARYQEHIDQIKMSRAAQNAVDLHPEFREKLPTIVSTEQFTRQSQVDQQNEHTKSDYVATQENNHESEQKLQEQDEEEARSDQNEDTNELDQNQNEVGQNKENNEQQKDDLNYTDDDPKDQQNEELQQE